MATTTTNFGWDIPQSTDLVKDGATAIAALGQDIDTALVDLKGGTTGQVLSKASNTDLDYSWVTQDDANAIQNAQLTAKGALISAFSAGSPATLTVGTNGQVLIADSTTATGLKWDTVSAGGFSLISTQTLSATSTLNVNNCFSSTYKNYLILINLTTASAADYLDFKLRVSGTDSSTNYYGWLQRNFSNDGTQPTQITNVSNGSKHEIGVYSQNMNAVLDVLNPFIVGRTGMSSVANVWDTANGRNISETSQSQHSAATSYDGFSLIPASGTLTGTVSIYGYGV
jgi:hypothetical protein